MMKSVKLVKLAIEKARTVYQEPHFQEWAQNWTEPGALEECIRVSEDSWTPEQEIALNAARAASHLAASIAFPSGDGSFQALKYAHKVLSKEE